MSEEEEIPRIRERYARRKASYEPLTGWVFRTRMERELQYARIVRKKFGCEVSELHLLEVGCGFGDNLLFFLRTGFSPKNISGMELLSDRVARAKSLLPAGVSITCGDASKLPFADESQDLVFQSLVFSSILDEELAHSVANEMWRVTSKSGVIIWYDFTYFNPNNPDVRGVTKRNIRQYFPNAKITYKRVTVAPPISRAICRWSDSLYSAASLFPFVKSHLVACISKL